MVTFFETHKSAKIALGFVYKILPSLIFIAYPLVLMASIMWSDEDFFITLLLPAEIFGLVTILRIAINEPRPYEEYNHKSVFEKKTVGKSMPSRHTASTFIISMVTLRLDITLGIVLLCVSVLITASRVLAGVHYIRDVLAGMLLSVISALVVIAVFGIK